MTPGESAVIGLSLARDPLHSIVFFLAVESPHLWIDKYVGRWEACQGRRCVVLIAYSGGLSGRANNLRGASLDWDRQGRVTPVNTAQGLRSPVGASAVPGQQRTILRCARETGSVRRFRSSKDAFDVYVKARLRQGFAPRRIARRNFARRVS
jgi:hypothetical protein